MLLVRNVFQAKYGQGDELVKLFQEGVEMWADYSPRLLTDITGPFFTIVAEITFANMADYERVQASLFGSPEFGTWFEKTIPLTKSGHRELYHIVE